MTEQGKKRCSLHRQRREGAHRGIGLSLQHIVCLLGVYLQVVSTNTACFDERVLERCGVNFRVSKAYMRGLDVGYWPGTACCK